MAINQPKNTPNIPNNQTSNQINNKVSDPDLKSLMDLREKVSQITFQFGQFYIEKTKLEEQENILKRNLEELRKSERSLAETLTNKYGKGSINPDTGEFVPLK